MANIARNGFRWVGNKLSPSSTEPPIIILPVASGYATAIPRGYPVTLISDGTLTVAAVTDVVYGISDGAAQYYDGTAVRKGSALPVSTTYGSVLARQSLLRVIPIRGQLFRATVDDAVTGTTLADYIAFVGENLPWVAGTATGDEAGCQLDISLHATTATSAFVWRIENIPDRELQDFASTGVSLLVSCNLPQDTAGGSTTGT
jgi:hypothetical protein